MARHSSFKEEYIDLGYKFSLLGATDKDLAIFFEVSEVTINAWKKARPEFLKSLKRGKAEADAQIAESLYHRAKGYSHLEEKIFQYEGVIIRAETIKHYPPDTAAAFIWLKNRQPDKWRDNSQVEKIDHKKITHEIKGLTTDELRSLVQLGRERAGTARPVLSD